MTVFERRARSLIAGWKHPHCREDTMARYPDDFAPRSVRLGGAAPEPAPKPTDERALILRDIDKAWAFVQDHRLAPALAPVLDHARILLACHDDLKAEVARLTAERNIAHNLIAELRTEKEELRRAVARTRGAGE